MLPNIHLRNLRSGCFLCCFPRTGLGGAIRRSEGKGASSPARGGKDFSSGRSWNRDVVRFAPGPSLRTRSPRNKGGARLGSDKDSVVLSWKKRVSKLSVPFLVFAIYEFSS